jgi:hypothetical protein
MTAGKGCSICDSGYDGDALMQSLSPNGLVRASVRIYRPCLGYHRVGVFVETLRPDSPTVTWSEAKEVYRGPTSDDFYLSFLALAWLRDSSSFAVAFSNDINGEQFFLYFRSDGSRIIYPKDSWQYLKAIQGAIAKDYGSDIPEASRSWRRGVSAAGKDAFFAKYMRPYLESLDRKNKLKRQ